MGALNAWMWAHQSKGADDQCGGVKESLRWLDGYERAQELPEVRQVYVADREADILAC